MPVKVLMPKLDRIMTEGTITKWLKQDGEKVKKGETLVTIETAKATADIEAPESGIFRRIVAEGSIVPVGEIIACISQKGEVFELAKTEEMKEKQAAASPAAKRVAKEYNIDLSEITGTGSGQLITEKDVLSYVEKQKVSTPLVQGEVESIPLVGWRKTMADRVSYSSRTVAHITTIAETDLSQLTQIREKMKEAGISISYTSFIVKAVVQALKEYPILNSSLQEDRIEIKKYYNIGLAVAREKEGLVVVVLRNADAKSLVEVSENIDKLVEKARENRLSQEDVSGGTFTITNVGMFGAILNTPIINPPEAAILGTGAIVRRPVVIRDEVVIRSMIYLCLTYDHRIIDGLPAIRFLQKVRNLLENPENLIDFKLG